MNIRQLPIVLMSISLLGLSSAIAANPQGATTMPTSGGREVTYPWVADQAGGSYRNPILCADYSDPDVIRVGDDFWMTSSSFNCTPGLPILHSRDLVNWTIVNHAIRNVPGDQYNQVLPGCGVWAPAIRHHDGKFWIFFPTPDEGIYVTTAADPRGQWSEPHLLVAGKGLIDPCPLWDDDGKSYLVHAYARSRSGIKHRLRVVEMAPEGSKLIGQGKVVFEDPDRHPTMEGPKFLKKDGWYYILAPAGGVATGWQVALRSKNIFGPYEDKIVLEQGSTTINGPHQGALVDLKSGEWWFLHFQELQPYGRIVHLQPVMWKDGWPLMGQDIDGNGVGEPVLAHREPKVDAERKIQTPQTSDEFDGSRLGLQWQWHANHQDDWATLAARPGWLRLRGRAMPQSDIGKTPHLLLQKLPARAFAVETRLDAAELPANGRAGLVVAGKRSASLTVERQGNGWHVVLRVDHEVLSDKPLQSSQAALRLAMADGGLCTFTVNDQPIEQTFQAVEGVWIGAKVGIFCASAGDGAGHADFDYFRFSTPR